jgi:hypothetical protein
MDIYTQINMDINTEINMDDDIEINEIINKNKNNNNEINNKLRPTFYFDNDETKEIKAGGVIFYKYYNKNIEILLSHIEINNIYEDLGGKTSYKDKNIYDTIAREVDEESNSLFKKKHIKERLLKLKSESYIYIEHCKYLLFFLPASNREQKFKKYHFGKIEKYTKNNRMINWLKMTTYINTIANTDLEHIRLKNNVFHDGLNKLCKLR